MGSVYHLCSCSSSFHVKCTHGNLIFEKCALVFRSPKRPSYLTTWKSSVLSLTNGY